MLPGTALLIWVMASQALPPVASMGSSTSTSRSATSAGELAVIFHRVKSGFVPVKADVAHLGGGKQG